MVTRSARIALGASALVVAAGALAGCAASAPEHRYTVAELRSGSLPSYLPEAAASDRVLVGTADHPALTEQGDAVDLHLQDGRTVRGAVSGPVVPGEGLPVEKEATTATFTVTLTAASAPIALDATQFRATDHLGHVYPLAAVPGADPVPSEVAPGRTVSFELRAVMITGEGILQWAPDAARPLAAWDFVVEDD